MKQKNKKLAKVFHYDLYGKRDDKYKFLDEKSVNNIEWNELEYREPYYFFVNRDYNSLEEYQKGFLLNKIFINQNSGIQTKNDGLTINFSKHDLSVIVDDFRKLTVNDLKSKYGLKDTSGWTVSKSKNDILENEGFYLDLNYRPFDIRHIYMTSKSGGFVGRPRLSTMKHFINKTNLGLITVRQQSTFDFQHILVTNTIMESGAISLQTKEWGYIFPLYLYPEAGEQVTLDQSCGATTPSFGHPTTGEELGRQPNLDMKLVGEIAKGLGLEFRDVAPWDEDGLSLRGLGAKRRGHGNLINDAKNSARFPRSARNDVYFTPIDLLDYIYAVLHSPTYREKYKEFLKIDFPRVPYPKDKEKFWQLVDLGSQIRQLHLLETADNYITNYPKDGTNIVERKMTKNSIGYEQTGERIGRVWINDEQYFEGVPEVAWTFYIGGYQPAQKWLKDRQGRELNFEDILHYQKIIVALTETDRLMKEVDRVGVE